MLKIGLTGGIGSGKTTAAKILKRKMNAFLFDADVEAKSHLLSSIPLQNKLINVFGQEIQGRNGKLNPEKLANRDDIDAVVELIGGSDIISELYDSGELQKSIDTVKIED